MEEPVAGATRARFVLWLHGRGGNGPADEPVAGYAFPGARWAFPTAPTAPVTCSRGACMPSWFDIHDTPITSKSVRNEEDVLRAVESVHAMIDREISAGTSPEDVFVFGLSQGGALSIASVLLYPKTLGGCVVYSGFLPFASSFASRVMAEAKKVYEELGHELAPYELEYCHRWAAKGSTEPAGRKCVDSGAPSPRSKYSCYGFNFASR